MGFALWIQRICHRVKSRRLIFLMSLLVSVLVLIQCYGISRKKLVPSTGESYVTKSRLTVSRGVDSASNVSFISELDGDDQETRGSGIGLPLRVYKDVKSSKNEFSFSNVSREDDTSDGIVQQETTIQRDGAVKEVEELKFSTNVLDKEGYEVVHLPSAPISAEGMAVNGNVNFDAEVRSSIDASNSLVGSVKLPVQTQMKSHVINVIKIGPVPSANKSMNTASLEKYNGGAAPVSISKMNSLLQRAYASSQPKKVKQLSARDRELLHAKVQIKNAPIIKEITGLYSPAYKNISAFRRSYELMERLLKIYIYKEGNKPVFHQHYLRGIYASEGWFMKLLEGNKRFAVRDPKKAHLFYLPLSSLMLRSSLDGKKFQTKEDLQDYLGNYVALISAKYSFWNRSGGADHFLVACHDWAPLLSSQLKTCIRALCNANAVKDFKFGKDTTLPVTYIKTSADPQLNIGGKPPSERPFLAFFAGGIHGYLRPILLQYWEEKEPDMKVFGQLPRSDEGKTKYREYMKSSKYCICAKGYEVHTPRVVEAIFYECVPVIISDNYVPPFFEVLNWETFTVFILEKDIPNLRDILLSIPEEKYLEMQSTVKMVQQHFLWHKKPVKFDLFYMILHSVWYNRVLRM